MCAKFDQDIWITERLFNIETDGHTDFSGQHNIAQIRFERV